MRILLVESEPGGGYVLAKGLREQGYSVDVRIDRPGAMLRATQRPYAAIVLDLGLAQPDETQVCRELRDRGVVAPIVILTACDSTVFRIASLDSGADDCLTKPIDPGELLARIRAVIRRGVGRVAPERIQMGPLFLDTRARLVRTQQGGTIRLTRREYELMEYFARHTDEVVGRATIAQQVWDSAYAPFSNVIDVYVWRLRLKLAAVGCESLIQTHRGTGYIFTTDVASSGGGTNRQMMCEPSPS
jgi:DNA-binding response OmpR family regulator